MKLVEGRERIRNRHRNNSASLDLSWCTFYLLTCILNNLCVKIMVENVRKHKGENHCREYQYGSWTFCNLLYIFMFIMVDVLLSIFSIIYQFSKSKNVVNIMYILLHFLISFSVFKYARNIGRKQKRRG